MEALLAEEEAEAAAREAAAGQARGKKVRGGTGRSQGGGGDGPHGGSKKVLGARGTPLPSCAHLSDVRTQSYMFIGYIRTLLTNVPSGLSMGMMTNVT